MCSTSFRFLEATKVDQECYMTEERQGIHPFLCLYVTPCSALNELQLLKKNIFTWNFNNNIIQ